MEIGSVNSSLNYTKKVALETGSCVKSIAIKTANKTADIALSAGLFVKAAVSSTAHASLYVVSELTDFASSVTATAGTVATVALVADSYSFNKNNSPLFRETLLVSPVISQLTEWGYLNQVKEAELPGAQLLVSFALITATSIAGLAFHKISKMTTKLNKSF